MMRSHHLITDFRNFYIIIVLKNNMAKSSTAPLRTKVLALMREKGPQTVNDLVINLGITNGSSRSVLVKMRDAGQIERIAHGKYQLIK